MRVVVGGASGMIGRALVDRLQTRGDEVVRLVRRDPSTSAEVRWDPSSGYLDATVFAGADVVVNLSGASISRLPWTRAHRIAIRASRIQATNAFVGALHERARAGQAVPSFVSGSAVGIYGDRPGERLDERAAPGGGFLAEVVRGWEAAAIQAPEETRTVLARTGLVIGPEGAVAPIRMLARLGLAGPLGGGRQHWPWVSLDDEVAALLHLIDGTLAGPVAIAGPTPATSAEVVRAVAAHEHRPSWLPAPRFALEMLLGDAARELLLSDQRVEPAALLADGFAFRHTTVEEAVAALDAAS